MSAPWLSANVVLSSCGHLPDNTVCTLHHGILRSSRKPAEDTGPTTTILGPITTILDFFWTALG